MWVAHAQNHLNLSAPCRYVATRVFLAGSSNAVSHGPHQFPEKRDVGLAPDYYVCAIGLQNLDNLHGRLSIIKTQSRPEINNLRRLLNKTLGHVTAPRISAPVRCYAMLFRLGAIP